MKLPRPSSPVGRATVGTVFACLIAMALGGFAGAMRPTRIASFAPPSAATDPPRTHATGAPTSGTPSIVTPSRFSPALAERLQVETGAKRWLLMLSAVEKATAQEMPELISAAGGDSAMIRMLAARWAELDPVHMFHWIYTEYNTPADAPGALPARSTLASVLFEEWTKRDLTGAIKALTEAPNFGGRESLRMTVANRVLAADPEQGLRVMRDWNIRNYIPDMKKVGEWAARDPRRAAEVVVECGRDYAGREALKEVGKAWGKIEPKAALAFAVGLADPLSRATLASEAIAQWAEKNLAEAAAFASQADPTFRASLAQGLLATWAKTDPAAALAWSEEQLHGVARMEATGNLIKAAAEKDIKTAAELVAGMDAGAAQNRACASIFEAWFNKGADQRGAAFEWLAALPDPEARSAALDRVQWNWVWREPDAVRDFVSGPHGEIASSSLIHQVARNQAAKNPEAAMEWASKLPAKRASTARQAVLDQWLTVRPEGAMAFVMRLPAGLERERAVQSITQTLLHQAPARAGEWLKRLPAAEQQMIRETVAQMPLSAEQRRGLEGK